METNTAYQDQPLRAQPRFEPPLPRQDILLGMVPFLLIGLSSIPLSFPYTAQPAGWFVFLRALLMFGGNLLITVVIYFAWRKGFPRWSFPYLFYGVVYALYLSNASTPGFRIFNIPIWNTELWGWRAWVPLALVLLLALVSTRFSLEPVAQFFAGLWEDWTRLVFGLYGLLPFAVPILLDEVEQSYRLPITAAGEFIVLCGAFWYLTVTDRRIKMPGLLLWSFLALLIVLAGGDLYWQTHSVNLNLGVSRLLPGPIPWAAILNRSLLIAGIMTLILFSPGVLVLANRILKWLNSQRGTKA